MRFTAGIQATFTVYEDASSASPTSRSPKGGRGGGDKNSIYADYDRICLKGQ